MTLTPGDVQAVRFRRAVRGYHTGDVDAFLDRVAAALGRLQERADAAPSSGGPPRLLPGESGEEAGLRTLVLAQRTADQVVADARAAGEELLAAAREEADAVRAEAAARARDLEAELQTRRTEGLAELEAERERLAGEVAQLQAFEREYRLRLREHLASQLREIDGAGPDGERSAP